jgi:ribonuclease J
MFSSNLYRVQEALKAAGRCGRRVALCGKSMVRNVETAIDLGYLALPRPDILIPVEDAAVLPDREVAVVTTGTQGEPRSALTLMALGEHKHIKVRPGDTAVLSSKFIPGNERAIASMIDRLFLAGADVLYEKISEIHVSGHGSRRELEAMIEAVRPANFVPVHGSPGCSSSTGTWRGGWASGDGDGPQRRRPRIPRREDVPRGEDGGGASLRGRQGRGDIESVVLKDRYHLSQVGLVMVVLALSSSTGEVLYGPDIVARGVLMENGEEELVEGARREVLQVLEESGAQTRTDFAECRPASGAPFAGISTGDSNGNR